MDAVTTLLRRQAGWLLLLAIPVACVAWTVTHEEVLREPQSIAKNRYRVLAPLQKESSSTSHMRVLLQPLRGCNLPAHYTVSDAESRMAWISGGIVRARVVSNQSLSLYNRLRLDIQHENLENQIEAGRH